MNPSPAKPPDFATATTGEVLAALEVDPEAGLAQAGSAKRLQERGVSLDESIAEFAVERSNAPALPA